MSQRINVSDFVVFTKLLDRNIFSEFSITLEDVWWILIRRKFVDSVHLWTFDVLGVFTYMITQLPILVCMYKIGKISEVEFLLHFQNLKCSSSLTFLPNITLKMSINTG